MKSLSKLFIVIALVVFSGCAELSKAINDNELLSRIAIKDTVIIALDKSKTPKQSADKLVNAANQVTDLLEGAGGISKNLIIEKFRQALGKDLSLGMRIVVDDLILILDEIYKPELPTAEIPEQYKSDLKRVMGYIKEGAKLYQ